jgi:hypothetical protein
VIRRRFVMTRYLFAIAHNNKNKIFFSNRSGPHREKKIRKIKQAKIKNSLFFNFCFIAVPGVVTNNKFFNKRFNRVCIVVNSLIFTPKKLFYEKNANSLFNRCLSVPASLLFNVGATNSR